MSILFIMSDNSKCRERIREGFQCIFDMEGNWMGRVSKPNGSGSVLSKEEMEAMKQTLEERRSGKSEGESVILAKIAEMREPDRTMAKRVHAIIRKNAPMLTMRTWYGMPAYADGEKVICFFQAAAKFKTRYATLGFSDKARLDEGSMWPVTFALKGLDLSEEKRIAALVRKAVNME